MAEQGHGAVVNTASVGGIRGVGRQFVEPNPMKHFGKPEEVGALVAFLLSNAAGFANNTVIPIDGGQHMKY